MEKLKVNLESGKQNPTFEIIAKIVEELGVEIGDLMK
ncbi:MAG: helix-turn-helix domain-containing protein [Candidatus Magasanikbacteria bacterium]|nr:helix-turn-helix domain-containing protein [Candidatus Magasanikbacteria bacterium]